MTKSSRTALCLLVLGASACSPQAPEVPGGVGAADSERPLAATPPAAEPVEAAPSAAPVATPAAAAGTLAKVFHPDMLDVDVAFFEQTAGVARRSEPARREYLVDGCDVTAGLADGSVRNLRVRLTDSCNVDLDAFLPGYGIPSSDKLTFGAFMRAAGDNVDWYADCLVDCGNAYDPSVYLEWTAPRANLAYTVLLEGMARGATSWDEAMQREKGQEWMAANRFNCPDEARSYRDEASKSYADERPIAITIGWSVALPECPGS